MINTFWLFQVGTLVVAGSTSLFILILMANNESVSYSQEIVKIIYAIFMPIDNFLYHINFPKMMLSAVVREMVMRGY